MEQNKPLKILLVCNASISTTILVSKMKDASVRREMHVEIKSLPSDLAKSELKGWHVILLGPQIAFMLPSFRKLTKEPIDVIPASIYARSGGSDALEFAISLISKSSQSE